ncbi:MAG: helix-turn-helix transcriptional regulator [Ruminococcus sp.]|nr:helix-turn-helix transcriptional regulator [Ruminococcus sp.]
MPLVEIYCGLCYDEFTQKKGGDLMELCKTIRKLRTEKEWSQEMLAEKAYVSRQTVSNWENEKCYPDVHSLLILSGLFGVSLDELIKGDVETMKKTVNEKDAKTLKTAQWCGVLGLVAMMLTTAIFENCGEVGRVIGAVLAGGLAVLTFLSFHRMETIKADNDIQTQREILAFVNGETLDDIEKEKEQKNRRTVRNSLLAAAAIGGISMVYCIIRLIIELM